MPPASSPSPIASSTTRRLSPSRASPIVSRKRANGPSNGHDSETVANDEPVAATLARQPLHHPLRDPGPLDPRASARRRRVARRPPYADLGTLRHSIGRALRGGNARPADRHPPLYRPRQSRSLTAGGSASP